MRPCRRTAGRWNQRAYLAQSRAASAAQTSPWLAAGTSLLSGASGLAGSLYNYYQTRPTTNSALCAAAGC